MVVGPSLQSLHQEVASIACYLGPIHFRAIQSLFGVQLLDKHGPDEWQEFSCSHSGEHQHRRYRHPVGLLYGQLGWEPPCTKDQIADSVEDRYRAGFKTDVRA
jgi:hypothetical protein